MSPNFGECAPVQVVVPAGKSYHVSVWSFASWQAGAASNAIRYCSARRQTSAPAEAGPSCITPFGVVQRQDVDANEFDTGASGGETTLGPGTWNLSTAIQVSAALPLSGDFSNRRVITKVLVRDAANGAPVGSRVTALKSPRR